MQTRHLMQKNMVTVQLHASVQEAAQKMKDQNVGSVIVCEDGLKIKGIITDRDIALETAAKNKNANSTCVCEVMSTDVITADIDTDIDAAIRIMNRAKVRRLPILENGKLVGVLSLADIAAGMKEEFDQFIGLEEATLKG